MSKWLQQSELAHYDKNSSGTALEKEDRNSLLSIPFKPPISQILKKNIKTDIYQIKLWL